MSISKSKMLQFHLKVRASQHTLTFKVMGFSSSEILTKISKNLSRLEKSVAATVQSHVLTKQCWVWYWAEHIAEIRQEKASKPSNVLSVVLVARFPMHQSGNPTVNFPMPPSTFQCWVALQTHWRCSNLRLWSFETKQLVLAGSQKLGNETRMHPFWIIF